MCYSFQTTTNVGEEISTDLALITKDRDMLRDEVMRLRAAIHEVLGNGADESIWPVGTLDTVALLNYVNKLRSSK